jgi:hypothetical protein
MMILVLLHGLISPGMSRREFLVLFGATVLAVAGVPGWPRRRDSPSVTLAQQSSEPPAASAYGTGSYGAGVYGGGQ